MANVTITARDAHADSMKLSAVAEDGFYEVIASNSKNHQVGDVVLVSGEFTYNPRTGNHNTHRTTSPNAKRTTVSSRKVKGFSVEQ